MDWSTAYKSFMFIDSSYNQGGMALAVATIAIPWISNKIRKVRASKTVMSEIETLHLAQPEAQFTALEVPTVFNPGQTVQSIQDMRQRFENVRNR